MAQRGNPVAYAENELGVHSVYADLQQQTAYLEEVRRQHTDLVIQKRNREIALEDREGELADELRLSNVECSEAAFQRLLKDTLRHDEKYRQLRSEHHELSIAATQVEAELESGKAKQRMLTARVGQIGDLLRFYAAGKDAVTVAKMLTHDAAQSWPY